MSNIIIINTNQVYILLIYHITVIILWVDVKHGGGSRFSDNGHPRGYFYAFKIPSDMFKDL